MDFKDYYANRETCYADILKAREAGGKKSTTFDQFENIIKSLGLMYLYCPEDLKDTVYGQMEEMTRRQMYASTAALRNLCK